MNIYAVLVILGMVLVLTDLLIVAVKGSPFADHVLLNLGVLIMGIGVLAGNPVITSLHN